MDWIDEQLVKIKNKLKMKSLKYALYIYILITIFVVIGMYFLTSLYCESWKQIIYGKYISDINTTIPLVHSVQVERQDIKGLEIIDGIQTYSIILYAIAGVIAASNLFYKNRVKDPINVLKEKAAYISRNDLSVSCKYESGDEFGEVSEAFEKVRLQLIRNNENTWSLMEGQRLLNATFAHDIRTPLTVLQGYADMLVRYYPKGKISEEKLMDTITLMQNQLIRLREFSDTMKGLQDMESLLLKPLKKSFSNLTIQIGKTLEGIQEHHKIEIAIKSNIESLSEERSKGFYDEGVILEVVDNLLSNACSYGKGFIEVYIEVEEAYLNIYVCDDGNGFSKEELYTALNPYYSKNKGSEHFGIGLTISKMLCEKHGGKITLSNSIKHGGAIVCASFRVM